MSWKKNDNRQSVPGFLLDAVNFPVANSATDHGGLSMHNDLNNAFFVDTSEAGVPVNRNNGLKTPGWSLFKQYGNGRRYVETLVVIRANPLESGDDGITGETQVEDLTVIDATVAATLTNYSENLTSIPPTFSFTSVNAGEWVWDFHSESTAPAPGQGDIASGGSTIVGGINIDLEIDLSEYPETTGYLFHRVISPLGISNVVRSGLITVPEAIIRVGVGVGVSGIVSPIPGQLAGDTVFVITFRANPAAPTTGTGFTSSYTGVGVGGNQSFRVQQRVCTADGESFTGFTNAGRILAIVFRNCSGIGAFQWNSTDVHSTPIIPEVTPVGIGGSSWSVAAILPRSTTYDPGDVGDFTNEISTGSSWLFSKGPTSDFSEILATNPTSGASAGHIALQFEVLST